jgi:very-short-patch-repair endonuclease
VRGTPKDTRALAKGLRRKMSLPEVLLWRQIKGGQVEGLRFRRQHPVGPYVLDFYCAALRLAVEVDGYSHGVGDHPLRDDLRDLYLAEQGIRTPRLRAGLILESVDDAVATLKANLRAP